MIDKKKQTREVLQQIQKENEAIPRLSLELKETREELRKVHGENQALAQFIDDLRNEQKELKKKVKTVGRFTEKRR